MKALIWIIILVLVGGGVWWMVRDRNVQVDNIPTTGQVQGAFDENGNGTADDAIDEGQDKG